MDFYDVWIFCDNDRVPFLDTTLARPFWLTSFF